MHRNHHVEEQHDSYGSRDRRRERGDYDKYDRDYDKHDRERHRDRRRRSRSRSRSRHRSPGKSSKRHSRRSRSRSRSRERDYNKRERERPYHHETSHWESEQDKQSAHNFGTPNCTIMASNIPVHITENEIRNDILQYGMVPRDIRLIRRKDTGASRGFAFVEFSLLAEAVRWMESKQGVLVLDGQHSVNLQYSFAKENQNEKNMKILQDWFCANCGEFNFKRRDLCYKCQAPRSEAEVTSDFQKEISVYPTSTIMFRELDVLTTEDKVLAILPTLPGAADLPIKSVRIGRDPLTNLSTGVCYLEMNNTGDAMRLYAALYEAGAIYIDGRIAQFSYCKLAANTQANAKLAAIASKAAVPAAAAAISAAQWSASSAAGQYTAEDIPHLAEYSASMYAKTPEEHASYLQYYTQYYTTQLQQQQQQQQLQVSDTGAPDLSKYTYDPQSGYYFDSVSGLYYDAATQYFYNSQTQQFSYWDTATHTFIPVPSDGTTADATTSNNPATATTAAEKKEKPAKADKTSEAKRIAKDMEKWAKSMNQRKEATKPIQQQQQAVVAATAVTTTAVATTLVRAASHEDKSSLHEVLQVLQQKQQQEDKQQPIVAAYGGSSSCSDSETEERVESLIDWNKLACLLCKRQFSNKETLQKHQQLSDLHKQNLEKWKSDKAAAETTYRDRAKERRLKYGEADPPIKPKIRKPREEEIPTYEQPTVKGLTDNNVGSKMLQKMGWQAGQGLGKSNQGRTTIIEAERRSATAGLGNSTYGAVSGDTYRETVKKMTLQRYKELD